MPNGPIPGVVAFQKPDQSAILSQAAQLMVLGMQLRGEVAPDRLPADDLTRLGSLSLPVAPGRIDTRRVRAAIATRYSLSEKAMLAGAVGEPITSNVIPDLAVRHFGKPTPLTAAELMEGALQNPNELVRVSAATAYFDRSSEPARLIKVLEDGTRSTDNLTRHVAATALSRVAPESSALDALLAQRPGQATFGAASHTTAIIHGTWAANGSWWQPGGDFFTYLTKMLPNLQRTPPLPPAPPWDAPYGAPDEFRWSGGYSDAARALAANELAQWVSNHNAQGLDLITHSHGGSVAMLATQPGMAITAKEMVLLSCPVHFPKYEPAFSKVQKIVSVRVHLDLVILADRGGQRFSDPRIQENVLPIWFDHFATHDPQNWTMYNIPAIL